MRYICFGSFRIIIGDEFVLAWLSQSSVQYSMYFEKPKAMYESILQWEQTYDKVHRTKEHCVPPLSFYIH